MFFQERDAANPFYNRVRQIVHEEMKKVETGWALIRSFRLSGGYRLVFLIEPSPQEQCENRSIKVYLLCSMRKETFQLL